MNQTARDRIAAAVNMLRPDWPVSSLCTLLDNPTLARRPWRDVAVALTWVATEAETRTPARVLEAGPWWAMTADGGPSQREAYRAGQTCHTCGQPERECRRRYTDDDHPFLSVERARAIRTVPRPEQLRRVQP